MEMELLRKIQLIQLEIMKEVHDICDRNNITYFLAGGTMIGAIRHNGFIPWDDDLDIMLLRKDYNRLIEVLKTELSDKYWLQSYDTDEHYWQPYIKIRKKGTLFKEAHQDKIPDEKCGVWIDVFPLDTLKTKNMFVLKIRKFIIKTISFSLRQREFGLKISDFSRRYIPILFMYSLFEKEKLKVFQEKLMCNKSAEYKYIVSFASTYDIVKEVYPAEWFKEKQFVRFEDTNFYVPREYGKCLTQVYGDYMMLPPMEKRQGHNIEDFTKIIV